MGAVYRITNTLAMKNGVSADSAVNVHHVFSNTDGVVAETTAQVWAQKVSMFYFGMAANLSKAVSMVGTPHKVTVARLNTGGVGADDDTTGKLLWEHFYGLPSVGSTSLPSEVAVCLSHRGYSEGVPEENTGNQRPRSRRRGRFYFGPLDYGTTIELHPTTGQCLVNPTFQTKLLNEFQTMVIELTNNLDVDKRVSYGVYSPTGDTFYTTVLAHVNNAFDTVRRRGIKPTYRTELDIALSLEHMGNVTEIDT